MLSLFLLLVLLAALSIGLLLLFNDGLLYDTSLLEHRNELLLAHLGVSACVSLGLVREDCAEQFTESVENRVGLLVVHVLQERVFGSALLDVDLRVVEDTFKGVFEGTAGIVVFVLLCLDVADSQEGFQELSVVETIFDVKSIIYRHGDSFNHFQAVKELNHLRSRLSKAHQLDEVEEALQGNHLILPTLVVRLQSRSIELEILVQLQVVDRQQLHRSVEVFLLLLQIERHA